MLTCQGSLPAGRCGTSHLHPVPSFALINMHVIPFTKLGLRRDNRWDLKLEKYCTTDIFKVLVMDFDLII